MKTGKTAVILTYPGIGDIVWHIPFFQGLAQKADNKKIYLYSRKTTHAKEILKYDKSIAKVSYLKETRQFINTLKTFPNLIKNLRKERYTTLWIFHRSPRYAIAARISKIKNIYGFGLGTQKFWLTTKKNIGHDMRKSDNISKAKKFMNVFGIKFNLNTKINLPKKIVEKKINKLNKFPKPWITIGFSCNKTAFIKKNVPYSFYRTWRPEYFSKLINLITNNKKKITIFLIGAPNEFKLAKKILDYSNKKNIIIACHPLLTNLSIISESKFFLGNDSGPLNLSGALNIKSFGLFGASPPIKNIKNIFPICPPTGPVNPHKFGFNPISLEEGMDLIKPDFVFKKIKKYI